MSKIKVTFVETNCKKNGPIKQTLNIIRNMDKEVFEPSLVTVWPEDADNSMIDEYKKLGIPVLSANMSKKKSILFGKKAVGQLLEQLQPDIVQGVGMPPYRMTLGYKKAIHFVTLRNYCYEDYPDYYGKIPGTVMAFLDLNLIKKRMAAGEPFVTCSESLTKMYRSRQNMEIPYIRNGVDVSQYTKRNCDEIDDVRRKLDLPLGKLVDKYEVRKFIEERIGREHLIPCLGVWNHFDEIDFDKLPNQFVLKCTHDSGGLIICKDKSTLDLKQARKKIEHCLKRNYFLNHREWPYKDVKPRIIAEEYTVDESGYELKDYKIFCFDGKPKAMFIATDRGTDTKFDFFDTEFHHLPFTNGHPNADKEIKKPTNFDEMLRIAGILSKGMPEVRVDLYNVNGKILFGEMTFFHWSGLMPFEPEEWDYKFGSWIELPMRTSK